MLFHHFLKLCCLALLVSCQEAPSSQPQPADSVAIDLKTKGKTAKELLNVGD
jgi:hypothetical protein